MKISLVALGVTAIAQLVGLLDAPRAAAAIDPVQGVTVDAWSARVYRAWCGGSLRRDGDGTAITAVARWVNTGLPAQVLLLVRALSGSVRGGLGQVRIVIAQEKEIVTMTALVRRL